MKTTPILGRSRPSIIRPCAGIPQGKREGRGYDSLLKYDRRGGIRLNVLPHVRTEADAVRDNIENPVTLALFDASERLA